MEKLLLLQKCPFILRLGAWQGVVGLRPLRPSLPIRGSRAQIRTYFNHTCTPLAFIMRVVDRPFFLTFWRRVKDVLTFPLGRVCYEQKIREKRGNEENNVVRLRYDTVFEWIKSLQNVRLRLKGALFVKDCCFTRDQSLVMSSNEAAQLGRLA